jgi:2-amino-4-hydroxy-6-hydroxymethyldihydropteridine diphosphokinase
MRCARWPWRWFSRPMDEPREHLVFLGLGSNLGDRRVNLLSALRLLDGMEGMEIIEVSSVYETAPWGVTDQPVFLNMVALASTNRDPRGVLDACMEVESELGRVRGERWGPRLIDVDILLYDDLEMEQEDLIIPHPRILERDFVLVPLLELRPYISLPGTGDQLQGYQPGNKNEVRKLFRYGKEEWHGKEN